MSTPARPATQKETGIRFMEENVQRNLRYTSPIEHKALVKWSRAPQFDLPMFLI